MTREEYTCDWWVQLRFLFFYLTENSIVLETKSIENNLYNRYKIYLNNNYKNKKYLLKIQNIFFKLANEYTAILFFQLSSNIFLKKKL